MCQHTHHPLVNQLYVLLTNRFSLFFVFVGLFMFLMQRYGFYVYQTTKQAIILQKSFFFFLFRLSTPLFEPENISVRHILCGNMIRFQQRKTPAHAPRVRISIIPSPRLPCSATGTSTKKVRAPKRPHHCVVLLSSPVPPRALAGRSQENALSIEVALVFVVNPHHIAIVDPFFEVRITPLYLLVLLEPTSVLVGRYLLWSTVGSG